MAENSSENSSENLQKDLQKKYESFQKKRRLIFLNYEKKRHLALLKEKASGILSKENSLELFRYSALLERHLDWETRNQYLELLEEFMEEKLSIFDFCEQFAERSSLNSDVVDILESNLILLDPHEKSLDFSDLLQEISEAWEAHDGDEENAEGKLRNVIEEKFFEIQNYLNEE